MSVHAAEFNEQSKSEWTIGLKKFGNAIIRYCTNTAVDPNVLIEKYALENPWFYKIVISDNINQNRLDFGIDFFEDYSYKPDARSEQVIQYIIKNNFCATLEPVALISLKEDPKVDNVRPYPDPKDQQISLF